jgi:hypothetical protein
MRRAITDIAPNKPVTKPHNQLLIGYVVTSPVHTYVTVLRYKCLRALHHRGLQEGRQVDKTLLAALVCNVNMA